MFICAQYGAAIAQSVQRLGYGLDDRGPIPERGKEGIFPLRHHVQTKSVAHPSFYRTGTKGSYAGSKAAGSWS